MSDTDSTIFVHGNVFLEFPPHIQARVDAIVEAARAAERERAAKVCEDAAYTHPNTAMLGPELNAMKCAAAIRALK